MKLIFDMFGRLRGSGLFYTRHRKGLKQTKARTQEKGNRIVKTTNTWDTIHTKQTEEGQRDWITSR